MNRSERTTSSSDDYMASSERPLEDTRTPLIPIRRSLLNLTTTGTSGSSTLEYEIIRPRSGSSIRSPRGSSTTFVKRLRRSPSSFAQQQEETSSNVGGAGS